MSLFHVLILGMVGVMGAGVALTRDPVHQVMVGSFLGLLLTMLFVALQAPDVALSQAVVGTVAVPLLVALTASKVNGGRT